MYPKESVPNGSSSDFSSYLFKTRNLRGYNPLQTICCLDNTDQSKNLMGNYIIFLETLDKLVARDQIILCISWTNSHSPQRPDMS